MSLSQRSQVSMAGVLPGWRRRRPEAKVGVAPVTKTISSHWQPARLALDNAVEGVGSVPSPVVIDSD